MLHYVASAHCALGLHITVRALAHFHAHTESAPSSIFFSTFLRAIKCNVLHSENKNIHKPVTLSEKQCLKFAVFCVLKTALGKRR